MYLYILIHVHIRSLVYQGLFMKLRILCSTSSPSSSLSPMMKRGVWDDDDSMVINLIRAMYSNDNHDDNHHDGDGDGVIGIWECDSVDCQYSHHHHHHHHHHHKKPLHRSVTLCVVEGIYGDNDNDNKNDNNHNDNHDYKDDSNVTLVLISLNDVIKQFRQRYQRNGNGTKDEELFCSFLQEYVVSICTGMYIYTYIHIYIYIYGFIYMHTFIHKCIHTYT